MPRRVPGIAPWRAPRVTFEVRRARDPEFTLCEFLAASQLEFFRTWISFRVRGFDSTGRCSTSAKETMNTAELIEYAASPEAELLQLQLEIARRPEELAQSRASEGSESDDRTSRIARPDVAGISEFARASGGGTRLRGEWSNPAASCRHPI